MYLCKQQKQKLLSVKTTLSFVISEVIFIFENVKYIQVPKNIENDFSPEEFNRVQEKIAKELSETLNEQYEKVLSEMYSFGQEKPVSLSEVLYLLNNSLNESQSNYDNGSNKNDISSLKKRIKYCKNPMEKKKLEQELNLRYKKRRRR